MRLRGPLLLAVTCLLSLNSASAGETNCPQDKSPAALEAWKNAQAAVDADAQEQLELIRHCFGATPPACLAPLIEAKRYRRASYEQYASQNPGPKAADFPPELRVVKSDGTVESGEIQIPADILEIAKKNKWAVTTGQTRAQGGANPDQSGALALIHVPGTGKKDFFIQLNLPRSKAGPNEPAIPAESMDAFKKGTLLALSFASVDKSTDPKTGALWKTDPLGGNRYRLQKEPADPSSCQKCHVNPLKTYSLVGYGTTHGAENAMSPQPTAA